MYNKSLLLHFEKYNYVAHKILIYMKYSMYPSIHMYLWQHRRTLKTLLTKSNKSEKDIVWYLLHMNSKRSKTNTKKTQSHR